jgi:hypothetical protein
MPEIFLLIGLLLLSICAVLYFMPNVKILNFIDYGSDQTAGKSIVTLPSGYCYRRLCL